MIIDRNDVCQCTAYSTVFTAGSQVNIGLTAGGIPVSRNTPHTGLIRDRAGQQLGQRHAAHLVLLEQRLTILQYLMMLMLMSGKFRIMYPKFTPRGHLLSTCFPGYFGPSDVKIKYNSAFYKGLVYNYRTFASLPKWLKFSDSILFDHWAVNLIDKNTYVRYNF